MKIRRLMVSGLCLATALTFAATGCGTSTDDDGGTTPTTSTDPTAELVSAAGALEKTAFTLKITLGTESVMTGQLDNPNKMGETTTTVTAEGSKLEIQNRVIGTDMYSKVKLDGKPMAGSDPDKWRHLDIAKLPKNNSLGLTAGKFDPSAAGAFFGAVATVDRIGTHDYTGTIDGTKAVGAAGLTQEDVTTLGAKAKAIPFTAATDDDGRLTKMVIKMPAIGEDPAMTMTATYSDFGTKVTVAKPAAGEITEATPDFYEMFKS